MKDRFKCVLMNYVLKTSLKKQRVNPSLSLGNGFLMKSFNGHK